MSIEAMSWVLKQDISRSSEKFILVCLANYADERGRCYPSTETLVRNTGQDRKTVMLNMKRLIEGGHLADTGHRVGRTRSVPVYELVGMPSNSTVHYVYKTTNLANGEFYIGKRSVNGDPALDSYLGSGRWVIAALAKGVTLHKEIVESFESDVEARAFELRLFKDQSGDPLCRNEKTLATVRNVARAAPVAPAPPLDPSSANFGTPIDDAGSGTDFSGSGPVFSGSGTVIPPKRTRKRDTEPSSNRKRTAKDPVARGTRLPKEWVLPKSWGLWALAEPDLPGWTEEHVRRTAAAFRDHWISISGSRGVKLDWEATWRNWCRKADGPKQSRSHGPGWWTSEALKLAKGEELGLKPLMGESPYGFEQRIRATIDNGGVPPTPQRLSRVGIAPPGESAQRPIPAGALEHLKSLTGKSGPAPRPPKSQPPEEEIA